jgi:peptidoglycan hydrolase-like protein with peptidoglycan-binding domain
MRGEAGGYDEIYIPANHGVDLPGARGEEEAGRIGTRTDAPPQNPNAFAYTTAAYPSANEVSIPYYVTVHLASPNIKAVDVRVPFIDYIKNVCSSEIFPTWEENAIIANAWCQISFVLNRFYTVWYRSRGYDFDITNNTAYDQYFVDGRTIFDTISRVIDGVFNQFLRREGFREPYLSSYCNGTTATCPGLSQWGSQELALQGYTPIQIIHKYYPKDIQVVESNNFASQIGVYPGYSLSQGSSGDDVAMMQRYLNRISGNFYIPNAGEPDGVFGESTKNSVIAFQKLRNLPADGVIGKDTWYEIIRTYVAVAQLAELTSEGERIGVGGNPPTASVSLGSRGENVVLLQYMLNYISEFYPNIPFVIQDGVFKTGTENGVKAFQRQYGLSETGVVDAALWQRLYDVYDSIINSANTPPIPGGAVYPGTPLRVGSVSDSVATMQRYLTEIGYRYPGIGSLKADGVFGQGTRASVMAFQSMFGLSADGVIGKNTWNKIVEIYESLSGGGTAPSVPQEPAYPGSPIRNGARGADVLYIQKLLNQLSKVYPVIGAVSEDGAFGSGTQASVQAFQRLFNLTADGVVGPSTWNAIVNAYHSAPASEARPYPGYALRRGYNSQAVADMQTMLRVIAANYPSVPTLTSDGLFGSGTERSVVAFQNLFGLTADGVVGQKTWDMLASLYNYQNIRGSGDQTRTPAGTRAQSYETADAGFGGRQKAAALYSLSRLGL